MNSQPDQHQFAVQQRRNATPPTLHPSGPPSSIHHPPSTPRRSPSALARPLAGFTLIELLVVMLVIMILAGLMLKAGQYFRQATLERQANAEMTTIANAIGAWATDNGGGLPAAATGLVQPLLLGPKKYLDWPTARIVPCAGETGLLDPWGGQYSYSYDFSGGNNVVKNQARAFFLSTGGSRYKITRGYATSFSYGGAVSNPN